MFMVWHHTPDAAAGHGTQVLPLGSTEWALKRSSVSVCKANDSNSIPAFHPDGPVTRSPIATARQPTIFLSITRQVSVAASEACQLMGARCGIVRLSWWMMAYNTRSRLRSGCNLDAEKSWKPRILKHPEKNQTSC